MLTKPMFTSAYQHAETHLGINCLHYAYSVNEKQRCTVMLIVSAECKTSCW